MQEIIVGYISNKCSSFHKIFSKGKKHFCYVDAKLRCRCRYFQMALVFTVQRVKFKQYSIIIICLLLTNKIRITKIKDKFHHSVNADYF